MARRQNMKAEHSARLIHATLSMVDENGLTLAEILSETNLTRGQFHRGHELLKDTLNRRGTPLNCQRGTDGKYRYSIPLPINSKQSSDYELRRQAVIAQTSLRRLHEHALAAKTHHPQDQDTFDLLARTANKTRQSITNALVKLGWDGDNGAA